MSNILKGILNEVSPHNYDSDWDYQDALARSGKSRSSYRSQEDDTSDADIEYSKKMYQLSQKQKRDADHDRLATGTNEGIDDPWGDQGNFAGDKPVNLGGVSIKNIQTGDTVKYLGQPSKVVAMSKDRKHSRITITKGIGTVTQDVLTSDLQQLGQGKTIEEDNTNRMKMDDYYNLADAIQEKLRQAIKMGNNELVDKLSKERADLDARVKKYGLMPESQLDEISNEKLSQYKTAAALDAGKADKEGDYKRGDKRFSGIVKATKKQFANDTKKSGISQGINEFSPIKPPTAGAFGGNKDYGQPTSSRYLGNNKFVVGTTNNYVLTATVDKWGLEWDEDDEIWFLDSPGAVYIADATEGEIELPAPQEQRNLIHDLVSDYLNARNSAELQKVAAYFGHTPDGEMATNEAVSANRFNSKQEVINHFVKNGKSAAAGAAAWERGYRGSSNKPIELKKPPQRSYHDDLDDKRYSSTFENLGDQLKSKSLEALTQLKQQIEQKRMDDLAQWEQDFRNNVASKMRSQPIRSPEATPVAQPGEKHSILKARLSQLNNAIQKQQLLDKLIDRIERKGLLTPAMQNDTDTSMHVKYGAKDNYQSLNKKLDNAISMLQDRLYIRKKSGLKEGHDERDEYDNPRQGRDYGKGNLFVDPGSNEFEKNVPVSVPGGPRGAPKNLKGISKALPADAFGRTTGKIPAGKPGKVHSKMSNTDEVDEGWSQKYKSSINCSHPKGFSQKAHCAGKKKHNESIDNVMEMTCPDCGMCETHVDHTNLEEACWKGYHKEGMKTMFGKQYPDCRKNKKKTNEEQLDEKCWDTHKQVGMKNKGGRMVPKCVPKESIAEGMPSDNDMGSTTGGAKMTLGQWKQMWMKKMPNADFAAMFRSPPNMRGSAIAYFDGWVNNPDARWDPQQGVTEEKCPHCNGPMFSEMIMNEKKDACYYKVKSRYKVWPSAYASGALVKCRNKGASNWGNGGKKNESSILEGIEQADESLHDWFNKEKWVRMDTKGKIKGPCAREPGEGKPKCLPQSKAHSLGKKGRASAAQRKRREDPNPERSGKAINVDTKKNKG